MKMHGGEIAVRSSGVEGEGATFFFSLPTLHSLSLLGLATDAVWIITTQPENARPIKHYLDEQGFHAEIQYWDKKGD